jgi:hypothetical protein
VNSGSGGSGFLSPAIVYDAIDFLPTSSVPAGAATGGPIIPPAAAAVSAAPLVSPPGGPFAPGGNRIVDRARADRSAPPDTPLTPDKATPGTEPDTAPWPGRSVSKPVDSRSGGRCGENVTLEVFELPLGSGPLSRDG